MEKCFLELLNLSWSLKKEGGMLMEMSMKGMLERRDSKIKGIEIADD